MKILFLSQVLPYPLDAGPKLRAYYVLRYLAERHEVALFTFIRSTDTPEAIAHLEQYCEQVITVPMSRSLWREALALFRSLLTGTPFLITRDWVQEMEQAIQYAIRNTKFDFIHADQLWMAPYALMVIRSAHEFFSCPSTVLDQHNAVHLIPGRLAEDTRNLLVCWLLKREARLMACYETQTCAQFAQVVWVTDEDRKVVNHESSIDNHQFTIPICINPEEIKPIVSLPQQPILFFLGGMHWPPNSDGVRWFLENIWPRLKSQLPNAKLNVIGKAPPSIVEEMADVHAPGYVENANLYWQNSRVFIVPLRSGGGMRVKILDAWAHGLPVVSTSIGAEGIAYTNGKDILIADAPVTFAEAIMRLLSDDVLAERVARAGRATVVEKYNWKTVYQQWDEIYPPSFH